MNNRKILITGASGFIGTHLVDLLINNGVEFINLDIQKPKKEEHNPFWFNCNILDFHAMDKKFSDFSPNIIIHLAAKATMNGKSIHDFKDNTDGTENVIRCIKKNKKISKVLITSSQHVRKPGSGLPKNDEDYVPHGFYGESKVITERLTRLAKLDCTWSIIRPTTIWGPYHPTLPYGLWKIMKSGLYFHPNNDQVIRSYGYVKNVVWQIIRLLEADSKIVNQKVFYVGDKVIPQIDWINAFSNALSKRNVIQVPSEMIKILSLIGDIFQIFRFNFPMNSQRYFNLTTTNPVPLEPIFELFGDPPFNFKEGLIDTVNWLFSDVY